jgi:hypothetical protein
VRDTPPTRSSQIYGQASNLSANMVRCLKCSYSEVKSFGKQGEFGSPLSTLLNAHTNMKAQLTFANEENSKKSWNIQYTTTGSIPSCIGDQWQFQHNVIPNDQTTPTSKSYNVMQCDLLATETYKWYKPQQYNKLRTNCVILYSYVMYPKQLDLWTTQATASNNRKTTNLGRNIIALMIFVTTLGSLFLKIQIISMLIPSKFPSKPKHTYMLQLCKIQLQPLLEPSIMNTFSAAHRGISSSKAVLWYLMAVLGVHENHILASVKSPQLTLRRKHIPIRYTWLNNQQDPAYMTTVLTKPKCVELLKQDGMVRGSSSEGECHNIGLFYRLDPTYLDHKQQ